MKKNIITQNELVSEGGHFWKEVLTNAMGTFTINPYSVFRVRATGATTVTVDGTLCMTMKDGEIAIFNSGNGSLGSATFVTVVIAGAAAFVQTSKDYN